MSIEFSQEIEGFEKSLAEKRERLAQLEKQRDAHTVEARKARHALETLRAVLRGEKPPSKGSTKSSHGVNAVPVNPETGRPARGARRKQIKEICREVGATGEIFRTADVLDVLRKVEDKVEAGKRSYTYTVMNKFEEEGIIERKGRGKWIWKG